MESFQLTYLLVCRRSTDKSKPACEPIKFSDTLHKLKGADCLDDGHEHYYT